MEWKNYEETCNRAFRLVVDHWLCSLTGSAASLAQTVVSPGDLQGWFERDSNTGTVGLGVADSHGGTGSLLLSTDGTDGQVVKAARVPLMRVSGINSVSWGIYTDNVTNYARPQIEYWSPARAGTLVYEISNFTPTANTWANVVVGPTSMFRDTFDNSVDTLANIQAGPAGSVPVNFFQIGFGSTSGAFPATTAYIDYVELNGTTWDFEDVVVLPPEPPIVDTRPVPATPLWALAILGMLLAGVVQVRRKRLS